MTRGVCSGLGPAKAIACVVVLRVVSGAYVDFGIDDSVA
jgi:hypothetical protein